jgi:alpha-1,3-mannosyltransferase
VKITHVCRTAWPRRGGLEEAVGGLARAQASRGHQVSIVTLRDPGREARIDGVEVIRLPRVGPRRYPTALGLCGAVAGADLVHVHALDGLLDTLVARRHAVQAPIGVSTHGGYFHTPRHRLVKEVWSRTITRWSLSRVDRVWFGSEADRQRFPGINGAVVPMGIADHGPLALAPEAGRIMVPGRVDVHKGLEQLIDALPLAEGVTVEVVGPEERPGLVAALRSRAAGLGVGERIRFHGSVDRRGWEDQLARAERAVFPSRYEGFGVAALEAMAAGVPVVLSDIPAFRVHEPYAPIVSFADPSSAARALVAPIDRERVGRAREYASSYRWSTRIEAWEAEVRSLLSGSAS